MSLVQCFIIKEGIVTDEGGQLKYRNITLNSRNHRRNGIFLFFFSLWCQFQGFSVTTLNSNYSFFFFKFKTKTQKNHTGCDVLKCGGNKIEKNPFNKGKLNLLIQV